MCLCVCLYIYLCVPVCLWGTGCNGSAAQTFSHLLLSSFPLTPRVIPSLPFPQPL